MDRHLQQLKREISSAIAGITPAQLHWHPSQKWSAAEVLEHLYLTYTGTRKGFERVAETGKPSVSPATFKQSVARQFVLGFSYLPSGRESPSHARPRGLPAEKVLGEIASKIDEMGAVISRCEQAVGSGQLLDHPILGPLTGAQWRKFHLVHGLHHIKQIRRLREEADRAQ